MMPHKNNYLVKLWDLLVNPERADEKINVPFLKIGQLVQIGEEIEVSLCSDMTT